MADWTELDTNGLLPGEPFTSAKALAFFENPKAIAEGAVNAPKVASESLNMLVGVGDSNASFLNLDRVDKVLLDGSIVYESSEFGNGSGYLHYRISTDNGSTYGPYVKFTSTASSEARTGVGRQLVSLGSSHNAIEIKRRDNISFTGNFSFSILGVSGVSP